MANPDVNLADRAGSLVESHKNYDPRIIFFYFALAGMLFVLAAGLGYQQLSKTIEHNLAERQQNTRRILYPGPRGTIYARDGHTILVGNSPRWTVVLHLDELRAELLRERKAIRGNFIAASGSTRELPSVGQLEQLARVSLVQHYLDKINAILGRDEKVDPVALRRHFERQLLLPFTLLNNLDATDYAKLIERLPVNSPLEVYATNTRFYPFGSAAAHALGYVRPFDDIDPEDFPGDDLTTFKMKGTVGKDGLEKTFDDLLQGQAGGRIYRVDPAGYKIDPPLEQLPPKKGRNLVCSLDIDLQLAAEQAIGDQTGAAAAIDVATGEVLVLASKPDYDLNKFSPRATADVISTMNEGNAWNNRAMNGLYPPGSTFKILVSIAGMRSNLLKPDDTTIDCQGVTYFGRTRKTCDNGEGHHGHVDLAEAIAQSCDIYFYHHGIQIGPDTIAAEAHRFHLDQPTGIELPGETKRMLIPSTAWKREKYEQGWTLGDTANMAIGQGYVLVTPLDMACFIASVARGETTTKPTLVHEDNRRPQHSEPIGLTPAQRAVLLKGMEGVVTHGTAAQTLNLPALRIPDVRIAGKTGTAQVPGRKNVAWFVCFAPLEHPEIAMAVAVEGDTAGENFAGGRYAAPVAAQVLQKYFQKKRSPASALLRPIRTE